MAGSSPRRPGIKTDLADMERRIGILEKASRLNSASIGSGGLVVRDGGSITIEEPGDIVFVDENGNITFRASEPVQVAAKTTLIDIINFNNDGNFHQYAETDMSVPDGYNRALFDLTATAQCTGDGSGTGLRVYGMFGGSIEGDRVSQGTGDGSPRRISAVSTLKRIVPVGGADTLHFSAWVVQSGVAVVDTGQIQVAALAIFLR